MIGRDREMALVRHLLDEAESGRGGMLVISGDAGVGKSRLLRAAAREAERLGWRSLIGRAYPVETGIPYSPFADAFVPLLWKLDAEGLATLTRGSEAELRYLFPAMGGSSVADSGHDPVELKARLLWNFTQFLTRLATRQPLLLILDDLQWADASSIELLHLIARRIGGSRVAVLAAYNRELVEDRADVIAMEESLIGIGAARQCPLRPLSHADTAALVQQVFGVGETTTREFSALVFGWTRGNPFFLEEVLKTLVDSGRLREVEGAWTGWEMTEIDLPSSIRDAVRGRFRSLRSNVRALADVLAVVGTSVGHDILLSVSGTDEPEFLEAIEELRRCRLVDERLEDGVVVYDFVHPMIREALNAELGLARRRRLHRRVAETLESLWGADATGHADELAYHYARSGERSLAPKAVLYLAAAGRGALRRQANREAADYLSAALERVSEGTGEADVQVAGLVEDLARARQRLGDLDGATELWRRRLEFAETAGDASARARVHRRLGQIESWRARYPEALEHFDAGLAAAEVAGDDGQLVRLHITRAECLMETGRADDARVETEAALRLGERLGRRDLLARVHLGLLLLHTWTGPPERARHHQRRALELSASREDRPLRCDVLWGAALLGIATGELQASHAHVEAGSRLADEIRSPLHWLRMAELRVELFASAGDWTDAVQLANRAIETARALDHRSSLTRLLFWLGTMHFGRGDVARGKAAVDEAWELADAGSGSAGRDVHAVVSAYAGRAGFHLATGDFERAIEVAEAGLAVADRTGYSVWAINRLLPMLAEAHMLLGDLDGASRVGRRLRADAERLGHLLGLAWADACDALLVWLRGDPVAGIGLLRAAANRLETIPAVHDAARLRRHLAARLRDYGDREGALRELREIHETFVRLGAERELAKTREQIRELGSRPPVREAARGADGLSMREVEVARMAARGMTNKAIGRALEISPRTVSTHLSKVFAKLEIGSRGELAEAMIAEPSFLE